MRQFRLGQVLADHLSSYLLSGSACPAAGKKEAIAKRRHHQAGGNSEVDALPVSGSRLRSQSPEAALRSVQRLWPARYY